MSGADEEVVDPSSSPDHNAHNDGKESAEDPPAPLSSLVIAA